MADKIQVNDTLSSLDLEAAPEPYRFGLPGGKVITFKNPSELGFKEAEEFMAMASNPEGVMLSEFLRRWLSEKDYKTFEGANLPMKAVQAIVLKAQKHYNAILGDAGNSAGSES